MRPPNAENWTKEFLVGIWPPSPTASRDNFKLHLLDRKNIAKEKERLKLPRYNQMDSVSYLVSCPVEPDRITVSEYEIADMEHLESAKLISTKTYEEAGFIELKPERAYSIVAEWDKEHLDAYGFYGTGDYSLITE